MTKLSSLEIRKFRATVYDYFAEHGRILPWRSDYNPYHIFVSEVMLQQTQVDRVIPKFSLFVKELRSFEEVDNAPLSIVLSLWQGLGYNRRGATLKKASEVIVKEHSGKLPESHEELIKLPGIGAATASSIAAFAYNKPTVFLETNIRTVLIYHFFKDRHEIHDSELFDIAQSIIDKKNPRKWYSALMDYGTMLKKVHGNLSRWSAHYQKQSAFEGSRRQIRGRIIKALVENGALSVSDLASLVGCKKEILGEITQSLCKENMISYREDRFRIS